jgi:hypothetical protein
VKSAAHAQEEFETHRAFAVDLNRKMAMLPFPSVSDQEQPKNDNILEFWRRFNFNLG